jgi:hypothetical protein
MPLEPSLRWPQLFEFLPTPLRQDTVVEVIEMGRKDYRYIGRLEAAVYDVTGYAYVGFTAEWRRQVIIFAVEV